MAVEPDLVDACGVSGPPDTQENTRVGRTADPMRSASLSKLTGVRSGDGDDGAFAASHATAAMPRLTFRPVHALAAVLLLMCALCASLTMLIQQSLNYAAARDSGHDGVGVSADASGSDAGSDSGSDGGDASASADARSGQGGASAEDGSGAASSSSGAAGDASGSSASGGAGSGDASGSGGASAGSGSDSGSGGTAPAAPDDGRIDLNTAGLNELDSITGVGPVIAQRILDHRAQIGRFASVDELLDVKGIGPKTLEKMRPQVVVR